MAGRRGPGRAEPYGAGMRTLLDVSWLVVSGLELALVYALAGVLAAVLIVTFPLVVPAFRLAGYALWPFGRAVVRRPGAGAGSVLLNVAWFVIAGWWLAIAHVVVAVLLAATIIGIPFAVATITMLPLALAPYGKNVVDAEAAGRDPGMDVLHRVQRPSASTPALR